MSKRSEMHGRRRPHIPVETRTAAAAMLPLGQSLGVDRSTSRARLGGPAWVNRDDLSPSVCSFVGEHRGQVRPRGIVNRLGEPRAGKPLHGEVFQAAL